MNFNKGDWVRYSNPFISAALEIADRHSFVPENLRRGAETFLDQGGIVVGEEGDQVLVLHTGQDSPVLRDRRDLKKIEDENE